MSALANSEDTDEMTLVCTVCKEKTIWCHHTLEILTYDLGSTLFAYALFIGR